MKILILILSYNEPPYSDLMKAQQSTFDSVEVEGVRTVYYHGGAFDNDTLKLAIKYSNPNSSWERVQFQCTDSYYYMSEKFKMCLEYVKDFEYDYIFRSNSSSYLHKQRLKNFAQTLPTEKLYAGWTFVDSEDFGGICVSGAGVWLSRDCADILRTQINPEKSIEEDVEIGRILRRNGIEAIDDKSRFDVGEFVDAYPPTDRYHYRLKNGDRLQDAANMKILHNKIK